MRSATSAGEGSEAAAADDRFAGQLARAKANDRAAFGELYRACLTPVYRYLHARVGETAVAEELTQEVFLAALAGLHDLRAEDETAFLAWLFQVARYKLADHLRRRYRRPTSPLEAAEEVVDARRLPQDEAEASEERRELRQALEQLTPEQREVVLYKYVLEYDNERTALLLGKNANAVNQLHHRALGRLQRLLAKPGRAG
jgi:RNA polymerase sigma-70 factor, ECF subfamily